mmetsp:Transcript_21340/g.32661  ORF Transcript_21340/g.32661 Transcript_21340/m.32661 type:complete len:111 (-) Transcript_21340:240-572(-)
MMLQLFLLEKNLIIMIVNLVVVWYSVGRSSDNHSFDIVMRNGLFHGAGGCGLPESPSCSVALKSIQFSSVMCVTCAAGMTPLQRTAPFFKELFSRPILRLSTNEVLCILN